MVADTLCCQSGPSDVARWACLRPTRSVAGAACAQHAARTAGRGPRAAFALRTEVDHHDGQMLRAAQVVALPHVRDARVAHNDNVMHGSRRPSMAVSEAAANAGHVGSDGVTGTTTTPRMPSARALATNCDRSPLGETAKTRSKCTRPQQQRDRLQSGWARASTPSGRPAHSEAKGLEHPHPLPGEARTRSAGKRTN